MCERDQSVHFSWVIDSILHACTCVGCECQLWESEHGHGVTCLAGMLAPGEDTRACAPLLGDLCLSVHEGV